MKIIESQNHKAVCEAYRNDYRIFKIYNTDLKMITKIFTQIESENNQRAKEYRRTFKTCPSDDDSYLKSLEQEHILFDITEKNNSIQFCLSGGIYPLPDLIFGITGEVKNSFGYGESVIKSNESINPDVIFALEGNEISSSTFNALANSWLNQPLNADP